MHCPCKLCRSRSSGLKANWSESALFVIKYLNLYQQPVSRNPICWKLGSGHGILIYSAWQGLYWPFDHGHYKQDAEGNQSKDYHAQLQCLTLVLLNPDIPCFCKQSRSRSVGFWRIYINDLDQVIWLAENWKWVWHFYSAWQGLS